MENEFSNADDLRKHINNNMINSMAFEKFILSVLRDYLFSRNKMIEELKGNSQFDAYLPNGIDDINTPIHVEIKRVVHFSSFFHYLDRWAKLEDNYEVKNILLIVGTDIEASKKEEFYSIAKAKMTVPIIIWDIRDFNRRTREYQKIYSDYINNPNKLLIESAINSNSSLEERKDIKRKLVEKARDCYKNEDVVLFLGAGVSIDAGIPLWSELVHRLLASMIINKLKDKNKLLSNEQINKLIEMADNNREESPLAQIRYIRTAFSLEEYNTIVHDALYKDGPNIKTKLLTAICDMCAPKRNHIGVKAVITYNFDDLLERALNSAKVANSTIFCDSDMGSSSKLDIIHVHGFLPQKGSHNKFDSPIEDISLVFSEEDYHRIYRDAYNWSNIMQLIYMRENTCIFIGCSINDPNLRRLLDVASRSKEHPRHFAFMIRTTYKTDPILDAEAINTYKLIDESIRDKYFASLGLNIIWVDDYNEIPELLNQIAANGRISK